MFTPGLDVLNCGAGHIEIDFTKDDPNSVTEAKKIIQDMIKRGYTVVIETEDRQTRRVEAFDPEHSHYIVSAGPTVIEPADEPAGAEAATPPKKKPKKEKVPMTKARATGIGRTAGG